MVLMTGSFIGIYISVFRSAQTKPDTRLLGPFLICGGNRLKWNRGMRENLAFKNAYEYTGAILNYRHFF